MYKRQVFYLTAFHWLEVNITVPAIWVHCQLDDVIPFCLSLIHIFSIDAVIGKIYPIFGICLIIMAVGVIFGIFTNPAYTCLLYTSRCV